MAQELVVDIMPDGTVRIEGKGFEGPECERLSKELESALGEVTQRVKKPEYHRAAAQGRTRSR